MKILFNDIVPMSSELSIDGSIGGGSVLRVALPLAIGLKKKITIHNIRKNRPKPGLRNQHLLGINALASLSDSQISGNSIGSDSITLIPTETNNLSSSIELSIDTAASVSLIFQAVSNYCISSNKEVHVRFKGGGTHTNWSPNFEYLRYCFIPVLSQIGVFCLVETDALGFYPKGGAKGFFMVDANSAIKQFNFDEKSVLKTIDVYAVCSDKLQNAKVCERMVESLTSLPCEYNAHIRYSPTKDPGATLTAVLGYQNGMRKGIGILGEKGVSSEKIGSLMSSKIKNESLNSLVDEFMADQLLLPLAFAPKGSSYKFGKMTDHVKVNIEIIEMILGQVFEISEENKIFEVKRV